MNPMKWYWKIGGGHTHVRVFLNGAKCGDLCFRNEEFYAIRHSVSGITFVDENAMSNAQLINETSAFGKSFIDERTNYERSDLSRQELPPQNWRPE